MPFEQDYLCAICQHTDKSCPYRDLRNNTIIKCQFYSPLPRIYQPTRKPEMTAYAAVDAMLQELERAKAKHPVWPTDIVHQVAIMVEEAGEALRAVLNSAYEGGNIEEVRREVIQTGAMAIRVLMNLEKGSK